MKRFVIYALAYSMFAFLAIISLMTDRAASNVAHADAVTPMYTAATK